MTISKKIKQKYCTVKNSVQNYSTVFQVNFVPIAGESGGGMLNQLYEGGSFSNYINILFQLSIGLGGILAVFMITYGGFVYMTSDVVTDKGKAKSILSNAIIGLVLLLSIWIILNFINPNMLTLEIGA